MEETGYMEDEPLGFTHAQSRQTLTCTTIASNIYSTALTKVISMFEGEISLSLKTLFLYFLYDLVSSFILMICLVVSPSTSYGILYFFSTIATFIILWIKIKRMAAIRGTITRI